MEKFGQFCVVLLFVLIMLPLSFWSWAYVGQAYWNWFAVVPFGVTAITKYQAISVMFLISSLYGYSTILRGDSIERIKSKILTGEDNFDKYYRPLCLYVLTAWFSYGYGWCVFKAFTYFAN